MSKFIADVPYWRVICQLDRLNNARRLFENTTDEEVRRKADVEFADCYDWLVTQNVAIYYDKGPELWLLRLS